MILSVREGLAVHHRSIRHSMGAVFSQSSATCRSAPSRTPGTMHAASAVRICAPDTCLREVNSMRTRSIAIALSVLVLLSRPAAGQDAKLVERGAYLMNSIVACGNCHVRRDKDWRPLPALGLSGGMLFDEEPFKAYARNITPDLETGIGRWTDAQIIRAIREGIRPDGTVIGPPMPIAFYRGMSDADAQALVAYLRAQPPVKNAVPKSEYRMKLPPAQVGVPHEAAPRIRAADQGEDRRSTANRPRRVRRVSRGTAWTLH